MQGVPDHAKKTRILEMKGGALDRTPSGTGFGRGCGPVV